MSLVSTASSSLYSNAPEDKQAQEIRKLQQKVLSLSSQVSTAVSTLQYFYFFKEILCSFLFFLIQLCCFVSYIFLVVPFLNADPPNLCHLVLVETNQFLLLYKTSNAIKNDIQV